MGIGDARGWRDRNRDSLFLDRASAQAFCAPGRWRATREISSIAHSMERMRSSLDNAGSLAAFLFTAATTATLSQKEQTWEPAHWGPHTAVAITMGTSSLGAIVTSDQLSGHWSCSHQPPD